MEKYVLLLLISACTVPEGSQPLHRCQERSDVLYSETEHDFEIEVLASWADRAEELWARKYGERGEVAYCLRDMRWRVAWMDGRIGSTVCEKTCQITLEPGVPDWLIVHEITHVVGYCSGKGIDGDHDEEWMWRKHSRLSFMSRLLREPLVKCE